MGGVGEVVATDEVDALGIENLVFLSPSEDYIDLSRRGWSAAFDVNRGVYVLLQVVSAGACLVLCDFAVRVRGSVLEHVHCKVGDHLLGEGEVVCADGLPRGNNDVCVAIVEIGELSLNAGVIDEADDPRGEGLENAETC